MALPIGGLLRADPSELWVLGAGCPRFAQVSKSPSAGRVPRNFGSD
jgi:hypothetical protein